VTAAETLLILGGTAQARELATTLTAGSAAAPAGTERRIVSSLAGRVSTPRLPPGEVRIGGFGGVDGLLDYLVVQKISAVIDATHPFAARITSNAAEACRRAGVPLLIVQRPPWEPVAGDRWTPLPDLPAVARDLADRPADLAVLLTTGRQGIAAFRDLPQRFSARAVEAPEQKDLPARCELILERGPYSVAGERELFTRLGIDVLVTKNSGGPMTAAKLEAARELGLEVLIVARPGLPAGVAVVTDVPAAVSWAGSAPR
jgi:precorrin-6A/cobalt-precorrin-6A reductase